MGKFEPYVPAPKQRSTSWIYIDQAEAALVPIPMRKLKKEDRVINEVAISVLDLNLGLDR
jgi:hypothetical protein